MVYSFQNDYSEGAHPHIMEALARTNLEQNTGYGLDPHCARARALIREKAACPDADVHFFAGGTQTNLTLIAAALRPYQAVISADTGHINTHETGAVEATGHKVVAMPSRDGKLNPELVRRAVAAHPNEHGVQPKMVYISHPTEVGTTYQKSELEALAKVCQELGLYFYIDGARLASALTCRSADAGLADLARLSDAFYIGGTKCGALFGEALVITREELKPDFRYMLKRQGCMFAKGRLLGIQFETLMSDGLYERLGRHSNEMAMRLRDAFAAAGFGFLCESDSNQQFPILPDTLIKKLEQDYLFEYNAREDDSHSSVRFVTSWATASEGVDRFITDFIRLAGA